MAKRVIQIKNLCNALLFSQEAEAVEADEDGAPFVEKDGDPERNEAEERGSCGKANDAEGKG